MPGVGGIVLGADDAAYGNDTLSDAYRVAPNSSTPAMACAGQDDYYEVDLLDGQTLDAGLRFTCEDAELRRDLLDEAGDLLELEAETCPPTGPVTSSNADAVEVASGERSSASTAPRTPRPATASMATPGAG